MASAGSKLDLRLARYRKTRLSFRDGQPGTGSDPKNTGQAAVPAQSAGSLDYLVGAREQSRWDIKVQFFGALQIDHELDHGRLLDRQFLGLGAVEDARDKI